VRAIKLFLVIIFFHLSGYSQYIPKKGGVAFRIDDNHLASEYLTYANVFDNFGYKYNFALNLALINPSDTQLLNTIRYLTNNGHVMMDHTPNHRTNYFTVRYYSDTSLYSGKVGIDHINGLKVCLKVDSFKTNTFNDEGPIWVSGNKVISVNNGEFKYLTTIQNIQAIYIPSLNKLYGYYNISNKNESDPDTLYLWSYWNESITLNYNGLTTYKKVGIYDTYINPDGIYRLMLQTRKYCEQLNLPQPKVWCQPGGFFPAFYGWQTKESCQLAGHIGGSTTVDNAKKYFNEYDPLKYRRYTVRGVDFFDQTQTFQVMKSIVANGIALNKVQICGGHFGYPEYILGGWSAYVLRVDSLLSWCYLKGIPVKTYPEWISILYDSIADPFYNIVPSMSKDLDEDGYPDGYSKNNIGNINTSGGMPSDNYYYISRNSKGYLCSINEIGGIERADNVMEFYTQGNSYDSIDVYIYFNYSTSNSFLKIRKEANTNYWAKKRLIFNVPDSTMTINLQFYAPFQNTNIKLSGISCRKRSEVFFNSDTNIYINSLKKIENLNLKNYVKEQYFSKDSLYFSIIKSNSLSALIDSNNNLNISKPSLFW